MARRRGGPAPATAVASPAVLGTVAVMVFVYYSTVFVFLDHWVGLATPIGAAHAAAVSLAVAACFLAFVCAAGADPGAVPPAFAPDAEAAQGQVGRANRDLSLVFLVLLPYRPQTVVNSWLFVNRNTCKRRLVEKCLFRTSIATRVYLCTVAPFGFISLAATPGLVCYLLGICMLLMCLITLKLDHFQKWTYHLEPNEIHVHTLMVTRVSSFVYVTALLFGFGSFGCYSYSPIMLDALLVLFVWWHTLIMYLVASGVEIKVLW
jgi:hypothetical protein